MLIFLFTSLAVSIIINLALFLVAYRLGTDKLTDISYALSFASLALYGLSLGELSIGRLTLASLVLIWAFRLGSFLLLRIWKMQRDKRFDGMRDKFWLFGRFWLLQALSVWVILLPTLLALYNDRLEITSLSYAGIGIWAIGLGIESLADWQKRRFAAKPSNQDRWIDEGLWHWSRHPNYFGEILVWCGVYLAAFSSLSDWQLLIGLLSPVFITTLLLFVSGIPILEKAAETRWGSNPTYRAYTARTSILVPFPPSKLK